MLYEGPPVKWVGRLFVLIIVTISLYGFFECADISSVIFPGQFWNKYIGRTERSLCQAQFSYNRAIDDFEAVKQAKAEAAADAKKDWSLILDRAEAVVFYHYYKMESLNKMLLRLNTLKRQNIPMDTKQKQEL